MSIQTQIHSILPTLAPAARRVAEVILADPTLPMSLTISELARACDTSEPSVVRFCRQLGFTGYVQLRLALAQELGGDAARLGDNPTHGSDIGPGDSLNELVNKIAASETRSIRETIESLDLAALDLATRAIDEAPRVISFGVGASQTSAIDLQHKLFRIGRSAFTFSDAHEALVGAALLRPGDAAIGLSHAGRTIETVQFLSIAKSKGAATIAITNSKDSPLATSSDITLYTSARETPFRSGAMASRIAQLTLVDCLFTAVAQRRYEESVEALRGTYEAIDTYRKHTRRN